MSYGYNVRASLNKLIAALADANVPVLFEEEEPWSAPCYRVQWYAETPHPSNGTQWCRHLRLHICDTSTATIEPRVDRLLKALGVEHFWAIASQPVLDWLGHPDGNPPPQLGTFTIERSPRGTDAVPPTLKEPTYRHRIVYLTIVHDHEPHQ